MASQDLRKLLYKKAEKEHTAFIAILKAQPVDKILESAYEKVIKDDILILLDPSNTILSDEQVNALLQFDYPLSVCYDEWMKTEYSYMEDLQYVIERCAKCPETT